MIARLKKERDEARELLLKSERLAPAAESTSITTAPTATTNGKRVSELDTMSEGSGKKPRQGITSDIITELTECNARLSDFINIGYY